MTARSVPFEKWQGLGNDFLVIEASSLERDLDAATVRSLCDRRFGVGGDGVLVVERVADGRAGRMVVLNADGSRPEMCGNGLRCVAAYLVAPGSSDRLTVATDAGDRVCDVEREGDSATVEVDMGAATFGPPLELVADDGRYTFTTASMGNPHAITFEPIERAKFDRLGPAVERLPEGGTNVELVAVEGDRLRVLVWERGVGFTLACGTGACAVVAEAVRSGRVRGRAPVTVELPGGPLEITVDPSSWNVRMRGPAKRVFRGEVEL